MSLCNFIIYVRNPEWKCFALKNLINYDINLYIFKFNLPLEVTGVVRGKNKWEEDGGSKNRENYILNGN